MAVLRLDEPVINPGGEFRLEVGDQLTALGTQEQLAKLEGLALVNA